MSPDFVSQVTLLNSYRQTNRTQGALVRQLFAAELVLLGAHVPELDPVITKCVVQFTQLDPWLDVSGFAESGIADSEDGYTIKYCRTSMPTMDLEIGKVRLVLDSASPWVSGRVMPLRELVTIEITPCVPVSFNHFRATTLWQLQSFLTFATDRSNAVAACHLWFGSAPRPVEALFRHPFRTGERRHEGEMLFRYSNIAEVASTILAKWLSLYKQIAPVLNAIVGVAYERTPLTEAKFLAAVQAAESFHRRLIREVDDHEPHRDRIKRILAAAPSEDRGWLRWRLGRSNELLLRERLGELFNRLGDQFTRRMFFSPERQEREIDEMVEWRNALTHLRAEPSHVDRNLVHIGIAANQLLTALKANILLELGFTVEDLETAFEHNDTYNYFARQHPD